MDKKILITAIAIASIAVVLIAVVYPILNSDDTSEVWSVQSGYKVDIDEKYTPVEKFEYDLTLNISEHANGLFCGEFLTEKITGKYNEHDIYFEYSLPGNTVVFTSTFINEHVMNATIVMVTENNYAVAYSCVYSNNDTYYDAEYIDMTNKSAKCDKAAVVYSMTESGLISTENSEIRILSQKDGVFYGEMERIIGSEIVTTRFVASCDIANEKGDFYFDCVDSLGTYSYCVAYNYGQAYSVHSPMNSKLADIDGIVTIKRIYFDGTPDYSLIPERASLEMSTWITSEIIKIHSNGNKETIRGNYSINFGIESDDVLGLVYGFVNIIPPANGDHIACATFVIDNVCEFYALMDNNVFKVNFYGVFNDDDELELYATINDGTDKYTIMMNMERK